MFYLTNEVILMESRTARQDTIINTNDERMTEIFSKVKGLVLLPDDTHVTLKMVADYYEVDNKVIEWVIGEHKEELIEDGLKVFKGKELKEFKGFLVNLGEFKHVPSLTLIPKRAILRIGMLLRDSQIAKQIRTYLLNLHENTDTNTKLMSIIKDNNSILIDEVQNKLIFPLQNEIKELKNTVNIIMTEYEELKTVNFQIMTDVKEILKQPLFEAYKNRSNQYDKLIIDFAEIMYEKGYPVHGNNYTIFNNEFSIWVGKDFGNMKLNKKDYWIGTYNFSVLEHFVYGVKQGIIVRKDIQNKDKHIWVDMNGVYSNDIEWKRTLNEFDNKCAYCGKENVMLVAEHIQPQSSKYGSDLVHNIVPVCGDCNKSKSNLHIKDWYPSQSFYDQERMGKIKKHYSQYNIKNN